MKNMIHIIFLCLIASCNSTKIVDETKDECLSYYKFLKENIVKSDDGWYEFTSLENIYKKYDEGKLSYPFLYDCLKGKDKAFFKEYFGIPHREIIVPHDDYNVFIYCFDEICVNEKKCYQGLSSMGFIVYFDNEDKLKDIISNLAILEQYRTLDRK